jgi:6-phosphofructokinase 1
MKRIAVLTSGGDAPGMNAVIRAVVRAGIDQGLEVLGVRRGYAGLIQGDFLPLGRRDVGGIMQRGGTILGSARCPEFMAERGRVDGLRRLNESEVEALVVVGGSGSQAGSLELSKLGYPVVGVASTIDNDLVGSEITLGVDTALNIALEAIDRLKTTASSHQRAFLIEVMGRKCGYLALMAAIAGGAEVVILPEFETTPEHVAEELRDAYARGKPHAIAVVAEGARYNAQALMEYFARDDAMTGFSLRTTILGHVQRGGTPTAYDRLLGTRFGVAAIDALLNGKAGNLIGWTDSRISLTPLADVVGKPKQLDPELMKMAHILGI